MSQDKSRLLSIGEAAKSLGITRRIILNYEEKGLIQADQKEGATGNRYYTADSVTSMRRIRVMQNLGLSLDDIYAYFNGTTDLKPMIARLEKLRDEIDLHIERLKELVKEENDFEIMSVTIPAQCIYCKTLRTSTVEEKAIELRNFFLLAIKQYGSDTSKRMFFIQYPIDDPDLISYCIAVPPESRGDDIMDLPEEKSLSIFYHGSYESIPEVREKIISYAKENDVALKGICRHIYLEGPPQHKDPEKFITQVAVLIQ